MKTKVFHKNKGIIGAVQTPEKDVLSSSWVTDNNNTLGAVPHMERVKVPGGWLILSDDKVPGGPNQIFVADPQHEWEIEKIADDDQADKVIELLRKYKLEDLKSLEDGLKQVSNFLGFLESRIHSQQRTSTSLWDIDKQIATANRVAIRLNSSQFSIEEWEAGLGLIHDLMDKFKAPDLNSLITRLQDCEQVMKENNIENYEQLKNIVKTGLKTMGNGLSKAENESKTKGLTFFRKEQ